MDDSAEAITGRVRALRLRSGMTMAPLAQALGLKGASSYQRYESPNDYAGGYLKRDLVARLAAALVGKGSPPILEEDVWELAGPEFAGARKDSFSPRPIPGGDLVSSRLRLPVFAAARGGDGHIIISFEPVEHVKMPAILEGVVGGYGLLVTGDSMIPAFWPGDTALVNPSKPPKRDTDVILYHTDPSGRGGEEEAIIKRLVGINDLEWTLQQYQPAKTFKEAVADWPVCHRVMGKYSAT
jgi:transcriptional regulator with XRE-family HTH domain